MRATVVIPTLNARDLLGRALGSLAAQTERPEVVVVDNGSEDGTVAMVERDHPVVRVVALPENLGFGRAVNRGAELADGDALILLNNDTIAGPEFVERILRPLEDPGVGMVAGVLTQMRAPERIDAAGVVVDSTLGSAAYLTDEPVRVLDDPVPPPMGPCGGAAAYRLAAYREIGGFDPGLFAYWEDMDLALRLHRAGWRCALAPKARAEHRHSATLGAMSPRVRRLTAYGRGYVLAKYGVTSRRADRRAAVAIHDYPALGVHLVVRREAGPLIERFRGARAGRPARLAGPPPVWLATRSLGTALADQWRFLANRATGRLPAHHADTEPTLKDQGIGA